MKTIFKKIFETRHTAKNLVSMLLIGQLLIAILLPVVLSIAQYGISNANIKQCETYADEVSARNGDRTSLDEEIKSLKEEQKTIAEYDAVFAWCLQNSGSYFSAFMRDCGVAVISLIFTSGAVLALGGIYGMIANAVDNLKAKSKVEEEEDEEEFVSPFVEDWSSRRRMEVKEKEKDREPTSKELLKNLINAREAC